MMLFHLRILLTSLNINSDCTEKMGNWIRIIYHICLKQEKKSVGVIKIFNIFVFLKIGCIIIRKLKFNGANSCIHLSFLPVSFTTSLNKFIFIKIIKMPPAESCGVTIVYIKSWLYYGHMTMLLTDKDDDINIRGG